MRKSVRTSLLAVVVLLGLHAPTQSLHSQEVAVRADDLQLAIGEWKGSLTYINYGSGEPYTMPADLMVVQGENEMELILRNIFPGEPHANSTEKIKASKDGTKLNRSAVISREELSDGKVQITSESKGKDDRKKALIRYVYILGHSSFTIRKEVQFQNSVEWLKRSEFSYEKSS